MKQIDRPPIYCELKICERVARYQRDADVEYYEAKLEALRAECEAEWEKRLANAVEVMAESKDKDCQQKIEGVD